MMHIYAEMWKREATYGGIIHKSTACPRKFEEGKVCGNIADYLLLSLMASCRFYSYNKVQQ